MFNLETSSLITWKRKQTGGWEKIQNSGREQDRQLDPHESFFCHYGERKNNLTCSLIWRGLKEWESPPLRMFEAARLFILPWYPGLEKLVSQQGFYFYSILQGSQIVTSKFDLLNAFLWRAKTIRSKYVALHGFA